MQSLHSDNFKNHPRALFYVQHLLGTGHLKRALLVASAMRKLGLDVYLASGGAPIPGPAKDEHFIQLPAVRASNYRFEQLIDEGGNPIDAVWKETRRRILLEHFSRLAPDVLIIESFPFGRRQFRFELIPLLQAGLQMNPKPLVLCSVRDIVQRKPQHRMAESAELIKRFFNGIMVHGDPELIRLEDSFPCISQIEQRLHYTGYVTQSPPTATGAEGQGEILVSAGGGAVGARLLQTALQVCTTTHLKKETWRFLVGPHTPQQTAALLRAHQSQHVLVEPNRDDFLALLSKCKVTVSQAGYNTIADLLLTGAKAVVVPFEGDGETEQRQRAEKLLGLGIALMVNESQLSVNTLAAAIDQCTDSPARHLRFNLDGANGAASFVMDSCRRHPMHRGHA